MLNYEKYRVGQLLTNCYLVWDEDGKEAFIIDPGDDGIGLAEIIQQKQLKPIGILATHGHFDHLLGALDLKLIFSIPFFCSSQDQFLLDRQKETARYFLERSIAVPNFRKIDEDLDKIEKLSLGKSVIEVLKTPGHTPGSICFYCPEEGFLFSGDTLFFNGIGSSEHKYSSASELKRSVSRLKNLPGETILLPGHEG